MNVLSLFDGMSCGQLALQRAGFEVDIYMACEIDKYTMQITRKNFPNTIQMGDVCDLRGENLPPIDLMLFGSPCQGFSFAGKQLNFKDPRSALFFQAVRLIRETKPKYFLMENVRMKQEYQDVISEHLGVKPIMINSALVSAQNRVRLYWTNIPGIEQPEDKGLLLKDILQDLPFEEPPQYLLNKFGKKTRGELVKTPNEKSRCLNATMYKGQISTFVKRPCELKEFNNDSIKRVYADSGKSPTLTTMGGGHREPKVLIVKEATKKGYTEIEDGDCFDNTFPTSKTRRGRNMKDKSNCLTAANYDYMRYEHPTYRKLTPLECERLQTVDDYYTDGVSNTQRYKMLGNGWTVDVICHIFEGIKAEFIQKQDEKVA